MKEEIHQYEKTRAAVLSAILRTVPKDAGAHDQNNACAGAVEALFSVVFQSFHHEGFDAGDSAGKTQFWFAGYIAHLARQERERVE
jgi:hypothetical protein